jgi:hypothetical protein
MPKKFNFGLANIGFVYVEGEETLFADGEEGTEVLNMLEPNGVQIRRVMILTTVDNNVIDVNEATRETTSH